MGSKPANPWKTSAAIVAAVLAVTAVSLPAVGLHYGVEAADDVIQPGDGLGGYCTLSFVFDGPDGEVYIATAAHCVDEVGQKVSTQGFPDFGRVAYIGDEDVNAEDFALIRVQPEFRDNVSPEVKGHPGMPSGFTHADETATGDILHASGHGLGYHLTEPTREARHGVLVDDTAGVYCSETQVHWGDSGGPITHDATGEALGIVSRLGSPTCGWLTGPTVQGVLAELHDDDWNVALRTV